MDLTLRQIGLGLTVFKSKYVLFWYNKTILRQPEGDEMSQLHSQRPAESQPSEPVSPELAAENIAVLEQWAQETYDAGDYFTYPSQPPATLGLEDTLDICRDRVATISTEMAKGIVQNMYALALNLSSDAVAFEASKNEGLVLLEKLRARRIETLGEQAVAR